MNGAAEPLPIPVLAPQPLPGMEWMASLNIFSTFSSCTAPIFEIFAS